MTMQTAGTAKREGRDLKNRLTDEKEYIKISYRRESTLFLSMESETNAALCVYLFRFFRIRTK